MARVPDDDRRTPPSPRGWNLLRRLFKPSPPPDATVADAPPTRIGRYRVIGFLGEGGMGRVHLAEDLALRRKVALKVLKRTDESAQRRFVREARAAARVSHPNLCPIFEVGEEGGQPFLAMELLAGETLAARVRRGPLPPEEVLDVAQGLLSALGALHEAGVVHRDVKASNLFLTSHGARLVDFGLAHEVPDELRGSVGSSPDLTGAGLIVGTPGYMAPEQILGHVVDARADLFSAGVVLYEALVGRRPFEGDSVAAALSGTLYEEPPPLVGSPALVALDGPVRRALAKKPAERYASARDMAEALRLAARATGGPPPGAPREAFVGREAELAFLEERCAAAVAGAGSIVLVTGERGIGKSALVGEFLRRVRAGPIAATVVAGRCPETAGPGEAFQPFLDATGRLLTSHGRQQASELLRTYAPTVCVQMPSLMPDPDGTLHRRTAGATKERLIREGGDFMEAACRLFPIVLFLEDLQWADAASVELLHHIGCRISRQRTLLVAAFRHADVDAANPALKRCVVDLASRGAARELPLGALGEAEVGAYLEARFPGYRPPPALAEAVHARTEGLALFVRSLVDILEERGDIVKADGGWALARPVPEIDLAPTKGLQDLVRHQLEGLPPTERGILEVASVVGREFLSPVIAHLVGRPDREVEEDLRRLARVRRLIVEAGEDNLPDGTVATRYRFAHALYLTALREDLVASRRVELHREVAARLRHHWGTDAPRLAGEIARHCEEGRDHEGAVAFRAHAGDNAARLFAYAEAEEHYDWAFRSFDRLPPQGRPDAALSLHRRRGAVRLAQARFDDATGDFEAMLKVARATGAGAAERAALAGLCDTLFFARRVEEMAARTQELLDAATRAGALADVDEARARMGQVLACEGRLSEAAPMLDDVIASARRSGLRVALKIALAYRALLHYFQTEHQAAEATGVEAGAIAAEQGDGFYALAARMFVGLARAQLGRVSEGLDDFEDSLVLARRNDDRYWQPRIVSHFGWIHRELGSLDRAREYDSQAVALARERPMAWAPESEALLNLCVDDVRVGQLDRAAAILGELEAKAAENAWFRWMNDLRLQAVSAEHWAARGDLGRAEEHAARLARLAESLKARDYRCAAERTRAAAALARGAGLEAAAERLQSALAELRSRPAPLEAWKSARVLALVRRRLGDREGERAAFAESARAIRKVAAGIRDETLRAAFLGAPYVREVLESAPGTEA